MSCTSTKSPVVLPDGFRGIDYIEAADGQDLRYSCNVKHVDFTPPAFIVSQQDIRLGTRDYPEGRETINLFFGVSKVYSSTNSLHIAFKYFRKEWINHDGKVQITVNDQVFDYSDPKPSKYEISDDKVFEGASIILDFREYKKLIDCDKISFKYVDSVYAISDKEKLIIQDFLRKYSVMRHIIKQFRNLSDNQLLSSKRISINREVSNE